MDVGKRSEGAITAEFVKRGYRVLLPQGENQRYDLVLDLGDRFVRVQCKTGRLRRGVILFSAESVRANTKRAVRRPYIGEVDLFAVYCRDTDRVYSVPVDDEVRQITLRVDPPANGQAKGIRWAADYELPA